MTQDLVALADQSRALIRSLQEPGGAYPASPTFSAYRGFAWLRDGAFIADGMSAAGEAESATAFFDWCDRTLTGVADRVGQIVAAEAADRVWNRLIDAGLDSVPGTAAAGGNRGLLRDRSAERHGDVRGRDAADAGRAVGQRRALHGRQSPAVGAPGRGDDLLGRRHRRGALPEGAVARSAHAGYSPRSRANTRVSPSRASR